MIYFYHDADMPLFASPADLSQQDRNDFKRLTAMLVEAFKRRKT